MAFKKRYILAQEAEERIVSLFRKERNDAADIFNAAIDACQSIILDMYDNAPDTVEVVRCKDCKWLHKYGFNLEYTECRVHDRGIDDDDYCSWGERREDDDKESD